MTRTVVHFTDTNAFGGTEQVLIALMAGLSHRGWRSTLLLHPSATAASLAERARQVGSTVHQVRRMQGRAAAIPLVRLARLLRSERPAVFHAHLTWPPACQYGLLAAILAQVPAIVATEQLFMPVRRRRAVLLQRIVYHGVDRYIAVSKEVARGLCQDLRFSPGKIRIVHNGVSVGCLPEQSEALVSTGLATVSQRPLILTVARLDEQKGHRVLLDAIPSVPRGTFVFAGDGPLRGELESRADELGVRDRTIFTGFREDVGNLLAACDMFVLPSLYEGFPLAVLEAMGAGKPVVATAVGGTDEAVIDGETGLLVRPGDPCALAHAIRTLLADLPLAQRLAEAGKSRMYSELTADRMVDEVTHVYDEILAEKVAPHDRR